jgi:DNA repair protein RecO (recombination protein O)
VMEPGNLVFARWQAKAEGQLGNFTLELEKSYAAAAFDDPLKLTALQSACALADRSLPELEPHSGVFESMKALLAALEGEVWPAVYVYWEMGLLKELGVGLDLAECAATGSREELIYVSPRSGRAVSAEAGELYKEKLLRLPEFLRGGALDDEGVADGLRMTGHFLLHRVFAETNKNLPEPRLRLEEKFSAGGGAPAG